MEGALPVEMLSELDVQPWVPIYSTRLNGTVEQVQRDALFLLHRPSHSRNFGHLIHDDMNAFFQMLQAFDMAKTLRTLVPFFVEMHNPKTVKNYGGRDKLYRCAPRNDQKWRNCVKVYHKTYPAFLGVAADCSGDILRTGNWLRGPAELGVWAGHPHEECPGMEDANHPRPVDYVLLPEVLAGSGSLGTIGCQGICTVNRRSTMWEFRQFLVRRLVPPRLPTNEPQGYVTFSLPGGSSRPDQVHWFEDEITWAKHRYGSDLVRVVNMGNMTLQQQATLLGETAVLMTNHGGGAASSIFLPEGDGVIDFWHGDKRMDHNFCESAGFFRVTWVSDGARRDINRTRLLLEHEYERTMIDWGRNVPTLENAS